MKNQIIREAETILLLMLRGASLVRTGNSVWLLQGETRTGMYIRVYRALRENQWITNAQLSRDVKDAEHCTLTPEGRIKAEAAHEAEYLDKPGLPAFRTADRGGTHLPVLIVRPRDFEGLLDYSYSLPTGKTIGKRWKRCLLRYRDNPAEVADLKNWVIGEYSRLSPDHPGEIDITWYAPEYEAVPAATR